MWEAGQGCQGRAAEAPAYGNGSAGFNPIYGVREPSTVWAFEIGKRQSAKLDLERARAGLEAAGVIFVEEYGEEPGVRLRKAGKWAPHRN